MNDSTKLHSFYNHIARFTPVTETEFEDVMSYFSVTKLQKGDHLIEYGQKVTDTHWVTKGLLVSYYSDQDGKEHVIQFANEGCWITDQQAFYNQKTAIFNIVALEDTELITLSFENREKLCATLPLMEQFFRKKANDSFVKQQSRLLTYMTKDATERFYIFLKEYPDVIHRVSKKILASYLGVSRETLSRLKN
ncbi:Crp/Fnr family transcriptional regulator [Flavobacterium poyangense]|uniref:Crp/Fnr family transcriptional regulator n=1 Tax=Flavobacterium poyangense TaxID=2204302 RepID=UPI00141E1BDF|nr:Crp/Fnr family transcriptional regulator [Flavobacterium sp. JXAS1]